jgi:hypothetical protein
MAKVLASSDIPTFADSVTSDPVDKKRQATNQNGLPTRTSGRLVLG